MSSSGSPLIVICGPTASGKSGLAIALAQKLNGIILSADSRQVYREFNIGTAKPSIAEQQQIPHYLIDICDPTETLTLADYQAQAQGLIGQLQGLGMLESERVGEWESGRVGGWESGRVEEWEGNPIYPSPHPPIPPVPSAPLPLLVGGTGLYIKSIVRGMKIPRVAPQPELRSQLQALGQAQCYAFLQQVDAIAAQKIHANDPVRTIRALEVFYVTGRPISEQQGEYPPDYPILQIGLDCADPQPGQPEPLTQRIAQRTTQMIEMGFVEEVKTLCQKYGNDLSLLNTLGYQEIKQYLAREISLSEAIARTILHTRQFAKRQRTWFRADPSIEWFDANAPNVLEQVWQRVQQFVT
jgi:tRNA dimethylallyltransferase